MKILTAKQLSDLDQYTCKAQHITSWELMERASGLAFKHIKALLGSPAQKIYVLAGPGNNGGDGLAIAYFLSQAAYDVEVHLVNFTSSRSEDNLKNLQRLKETGSRILEFDEASQLPEFVPDSILVDAVFGVGLNRPMPDFVQELAKHIRSFGLYSIAIDVPSGMYLDASPSKTEEVFKADTVFTFQTPKLSFYLPDYSNSYANVQIIDIGLSQTRLDEISSDINFVDLKFAKNLYRPRQRFSHKGTYGHAVIVGGSELMLGSVLLSCKSCMHSGVGKTSAMMPASGHLNLIQYVPEAMLLKNQSHEFISSSELGFTPDSIGIGVGIGTTKTSYEALVSWLETASCPLVLDADALNLIADHQDLLLQIPKKSILTPHPRELKRLIGEWKNDFDKIEKIKAFSKARDLIILAKDAYSLCVYKEAVYVNSTGNAGMATAGSGDVLTGLVTGLLAQGYTSLEASVLGMFIHGLSGDFAADHASEESLTASDLISHFGDSFSKLKD